MSKYSIESYPQIDPQILNLLNGLVDSYDMKISPEKFFEVMSGYEKGVKWVLNKYKDFIDENDYPITKIGNHMTACHLLPNGEVLLGLNREELESVNDGNYFENKIGNFSIRDLTLYQLYESIAVEEATHWVAFKYPESGLSTFSISHDVMYADEKNQEEYHLQPHEFEALVNQKEYFEENYPGSVQTSDLEYFHTFMETRFKLKELARDMNQILSKKEESSDSASTSSGSTASTLANQSLQHSASRTSDSVAVNRTESEKKTVKVTFLEKIKKFLKNHITN